MHRQVRMPSTAYQGKIDFEIKGDVIKGNMNCI